MNKEEEDHPQVKVYDNVIVYKTTQINMFEVLHQLSKIDIAPHI